MASGIRDKVAILGMGCSRFGERWNMGAEELLVEAFQECLADAGIEKDRIEAAWLGHCIKIGMGKSATPLGVASGFLTSLSPGRKITAPRGPRPSGGPSTRWLPGPTTSASPSGWRN